MTKKIDQDVCFVDGSFASALTSFAANQFIRFAANEVSEDLERVRPRRPAARPTSRTHLHLALRETFRYHRATVMSLDLALDSIRRSSFGSIADLLAPAVVLRRRLIHAGPPRLRRESWLKRLLKPSTVGPVLELAPVYDELTLPIGASRFDPVPDVPLGFEWPCTASGEMYECLAQFDLAEIAQTHQTRLLPDVGWLVVFLTDGRSTSGEFDGRIIYLPPGDLVRWSTPVPRHHTARSCRLDFDEVFSLPDPTDACVQHRTTIVGDEIDAYVRLQEQLTDGAKHYLLGYPRAVQGDVRVEAVKQQAEASRRSMTWAQAARVADDWSLLLQFDSDDADDGPGWMWGDVGTLYFLLHNDDLRAHRFERVRVIAQCC
jgi:Domain of unknown function (DUF1963)